MKTVQIILSLAFITSLFCFGCQSNEPETKSAMAQVETVQPFYLDIDLPDTPIDSLLQSTKKRPEIDIYLKTNTDSLGKSEYILSINKQVLSFDEFNERFDSLRMSVDERKRNWLVANLYIDKSMPYYLVDYLQKRIIAFEQRRVNYFNDREQYFTKMLIFLQQRIWANKRLGISPPTPLPNRNSEAKPPIFSKTYLATLNHFGIEQKHIPHSGTQTSDDFPPLPKNRLEIKLNANNKLSIKDKVVSLEEVTQTWHSFMEDESLWQKRVVYFSISGKADYQHYIKTYSTLRSAFAKKRNQLAIELFGKNMSELPSGQRRDVTWKLPLMIIVELGD